MLSTISLLFLFLNLILGENCDKFGVLLYEDLGCKSVNNSPCPTQFECTGMKNELDKCFFRGKPYGKDEIIDHRITKGNCQVGCICKPKEERKFFCAVYDCPEWFGDPISPSCYRNYTASECCSTGEICPKSEETFQCKVDGKIYKEGERFYPKKSCYSCACQKGFVGNFEEPYCKRLNCGTQLTYSDKIHKSCAPVYKSTNEIRCCSFDFYCPAGNETILGKAENNLKCQFGEKTLKGGEYIEKNHFQLSNGEQVNKLRCECTLPPFATCLYN